MSPGNLHSVVCYNFLNIYLSSLSALCSLSSVKCFHSIFSPPSNFYFLPFQSLGEWRGSCRKSHFPCPRFLPLSLFIVFRVCVFRAGTERPVTDPSPGVCFPKSGTSTPSQPPFWRELEPAAEGTGLDDAQRKPSECQVSPSLHLTGGQVRANKTPD